MSVNVQFHTLPQHFTFVDHVTHTIVPAHALVAGHTYDVFIVLENTGDTEALAVQVNVVHSAFGIGLPGGTSYIIEPAPIDIPPANAGDPGLATIVFQFQAPAGGHSCMVATIVSNGRCLNQNLDVFQVAIGAASTLSFLVYGGAVDETMRLDLAERFTNGSPVPPGQSWSPVMIPPPGVTHSGTNPMNLNLAAHGFYSVGLQVTVPANATVDHVFHIEGHVGTHYEGEVDIIVHAHAVVGPQFPPDPYITGGYQSPDIELIDLTNGHAIPIGATPSVWDTLLQPNTEYGFRAIVHNASPTPAVNTVIRFWDIPGGVSAIGHLLDVQTVTVPAFGMIEVRSNVNFRSAPAHMHECAAVSIYNAQSPWMTVDPSNASQIPNPDTHIGHSASAWRNTDSCYAILNLPWNLELQIRQFIDGPNPPDPAGPVEIEVETLFVPKEWARTPKVVLAQGLLREAGAPTGVPLFLHPALATTLQHVDLGVKIKAGDKALAPQKREEIQNFRTKNMITFASEDDPIGDGPATATRKATNTNLAFAPAMTATGIATEELKLTLERRLQNNISVILPQIAGKATPLTITGNVPKEAKPGDKFVVNVTAHYPPTKTSPARNVKHAQIFFVTDKKPQ